ncbi:MAG: Cyanophycin synthetase [candidate division WS6 bacterium OLB20]|uniref:Cyanophycin synthetase n=1 Tax=candidate division WS6 bacterium OLB20 TaxID=1617426 RepID=A0A136LYF4_9BACT|nr:MAG: Cyanophycin synthetase [candidate division WS6 bacterium OLB20]
MVTSKLHTDLYLIAAKQIGLRTHVINSEFAYVEITDGQKILRIKNTSLSSNDIVAATLAGSKVIASKLLDEDGILVPKQHYFGSRNDPVTPETIEEIVKTAHDLYPLVLKRAHGSGGHGVYVNVQDEEQLRKMYGRLLNNYNPAVVIIEEYIQGKDYRILVYKDRVIDVIHRIPAYITGDGTSTVAELIEAKNQERKALRIAQIPFKKDRTFP